VASRLPSAAPTESRVGRCDAADAVDDDGSRDALPTGIRCGRSRSGSVFRHRRAVFVQSAVDRPQPTAVFGVPSTPRTTAFTLTERLSLPLLRGWPPAKVFPSSGDAVTFAAATSTAAQPYPTTTTTTTFAAAVCVRQAPAVQIARKPSPGRRT